MNEILLPLSQEERDLLRRLLETALGDSRVEVHRTTSHPHFASKCSTKNAGFQGFWKS
jgi:hypothetical protein